MKILFLASGKQTPASRFRIVPYVEAFRRAGHRCDIAYSFPEKYDYFPWLGFRPSQSLKRGVRWWHWLQAKLQRFDIVYIEREIFDSPSSVMEKRFRGVCQKLVLDIDDAVFLRYPNKFAEILPLADLVVCGNRFIEETVNASNHQTLCLPTSIDLSRYPRRPIHSDVAVPVVGWMGTTGNLHNLCAVAGALRTVAAETPFRLRLIVPDLSPIATIDLTGVTVEHHLWSAITETEELSRMDIGLMPLSHDQEWDRYKCGAKLLQYLAVGVPGIASPVGVNADILQDNLTGFSATNETEWTQALRILLNDAPLRERMGVAGRALVEVKYSVEVNFPRLAAALTELLYSQTD